MTNGNNTNIVHVNAIQGLLSEVVKHLKALEPDDSNVNRFSEQTIAKENAIDGLVMLQTVDIHKLQQEYE